MATGGAGLSLWIATFTVGERDQTVRLADLVEHGLSVAQGMAQRVVRAAALTILITCRSDFGLGTDAMSNTAKAIRLPDDLQAFAEERVRAGEYRRVDEVASAAVRLLRQRDQRRAEVRAELGGIFEENLAKLREAVAGEIKRDPLLPSAS